MLFSGGRCGGGCLYTTHDKQEKYSNTTVREEGEKDVPQQREMPRGCSIVLARLRSHCPAPSFPEQHVYR
jgi:hypothetical protein